MRDEFKAYGQISINSDFSLGMTARQEDLLRRMMTEQQESTPEQVKKAENVLLWINKNYNDIVNVAHMEKKAGTHYRYLGKSNVKETLIIQKNKFQAAATKLNSIRNVANMKVTPKPKESLEPGELPKPVKNNEEVPKTKKINNKTSKLNTTVSQLGKMNRTKTGGMRDEFKAYGQISINPDFSLEMTARQEDLLRRMMTEQQESNPEQVKKAEKNKFQAAATKLTSVRNVANMKVTPKPKESPEQVPVKNNQEVPKKKNITKETSKLNTPAITKEKKTEGNSEKSVNFDQSQRDSLETKHHNETTLQKRTKTQTTEEPNLSMIDIRSHLKSICIMKSPWKTYHKVSTYKNRNEMLCS